MNNCFSKYLSKNYNINIPWEIWQKIIWMSKIIQFNDEKRCIVREYRSNGKLWYEINYKDGKRHGLCRGTEALSRHFITMRTIFNK